MTKTSAFAEQRFMEAAYKFNTKAHHVKLKKRSLISKFASIIAGFYFV